MKKRIKKTKGSNQLIIVFTPHRTKSVDGKEMYLFSSQPHDNLVTSCEKVVKTN